MTTSTNTLLKATLSDNRILWCIIILSSLLLSGIIIWQNPITNIDSILYLDLAHSYLHHDFQTVFSSYIRPFYSILIAQISQITQIPLLQSAQLFNSILIIGIIIILLKIQNILSNKNTTLFIATALLILLHTEFNDKRFWIIRDFGYWLFSYLSLYAVLLAIKKQIFWYGSILWFCSLIIAITFKVEAMIYIFIPYIVVFFNSWTKKIRLKWLLCFSLPPVLLCITFWLIQHHWYTELSYNLWLFLTEGHRNILINLHHSTQYFIETIATEIINPHDNQFAPLAFLLIIFSILLGNIIETLGTPYTLLCIFALYHLKKYFKNHTKQQLIETSDIAVLSMIILATIIAILFACYWRFIPERYLILPLLLSFIYLAHYLLHLWNIRNFHRYRYYWSFAIIILLIMGTISFGPSKEHIIKAHQLVSNSTENNIAIYSNYPHTKSLLIPENHESITIRRELDIIKESEYLWIVSLSRHYKDLALFEHHIRQNSNIKDIQVLKNSHGDKIFILQVDSRASPAQH